MSLQADPRDAAEYAAGLREVFRHTHGADRVANLVMCYEFLVTCANRAIGQLEAIARREAEIDRIRGGSTAASGTAQDFADMLRHALGEVKA